ncbi:MAG: DUF2723 domain-containing protein [Verrucomicrobiota bacterium]
MITSLLVYSLTMAPTVTLELSGSLVTAADYLGVANSPGYPLWTLLAWFFQRAFGFVRYHGHPNPAWGAGFMSAFFGSLTCGLVAWLVCRSCRNWLAGTSAGPAARHPCAACWASGTSSSLVLAFSGAMWSQSAIAATYTLNAFVLALFLLAAYGWVSTGRRRHLYALAFLAGIGITTAPISLLLIPVVPVVIWVRRDSLRNAWPLAGVVLSAAAGLLPLVYLPFASEQNPPINWAYARTWIGFKHLVSGGQYERIVFLNVIRHPAIYLGHLKDYVVALAGQFTWPALLVGALPLAALGTRATAMRRWLAVSLLAFLLLSAGFVAAAHPSPDVQTMLIARVHMIPSHVVFALWLGYGLFMLATAERDLVGRRPMHSGRAGNML